MSKLTDDEIRRIELTVHGYTRQPLDVKAFARAIESAATEPLLQRIAELEQRNSDLHEDVQRFKKHALNEKAARLELERQLEEARKQMEAQKDEWLSWEAKRKALEKDAERYRFIRDANRSSCIDDEIGMYAMESLDEYVDAAMEDEARIVRGAAMQKGQS